MTASRNADRGNPPEDFPLSAWHAVLSVVDSLPGRDWRLVRDSSGLLAHGDAIEAHPSWGTSYSDGKGGWRREPVWRRVEAS